MIKNILKFIYSHIRGLQVFLNFGNYTTTRVFYGGAYKGNAGGTLVKIKRLSLYFKEYNFTFNTVYVLSNSPYLPTYALNHLKKKKIPIIHNQNGVFYPSWYSGDYLAKNKIMQNQYQKADYIFFQSIFCKQIAEKFLGKSLCESEVLYNSVDTSFFKPGNIKLENDNFIFLITGKFYSHLFYSLECVILAIEIAKKNNLNFSFRIAGIIDLKTQKKIIDLINKRNLKDKVEITGPYKQENANKVYQKVNAFVYMSHNAPCPNSVIEALSSGLPVLYSNSGGIPEIVGDECGIGIDTKDSFENPTSPSPQMIYEGMLEIIKNHSLMSYNSRERAVKFFDIANWILKHKQIFKKLKKNV